MIINFIVPGKAIGKQRPRFARQGNFTKVYTPEKTVNYENWIKQCFISKYPNFKPLENPLRIHVRAFLFQAKSNRMPKPTIKPDADNILKSIADGLNGLAYIDDKQIVACVVEKYWGEIESVKIEIEEI